MTEYGDQSDPKNGTCIGDKADLDSQEGLTTPLNGKLETQRDQDEG